MIYAHILIALSLILLHFETKIEYGRGLEQKWRLLPAVVRDLHTFGSGRDFKRPQYMAH